MKYFFMLFVCLTLSHFGYTQNDDRGYIVKVGDKAPDITITYTDGTRKKLSDFRGNRHVTIYSQLVRSMP